jgi:two-component system OmpR family sensor kinase
VQHILGRLIVLEMLIGTATVVLAAVATGLGVRWQLRNLYTVTRTAQEVARDLSPEGAALDRRVPVAEPGTEVGTLAESMNTLLSSVETQFAARVESEDRMRQFLADASHELRTPLTSIRGYAELARMQGAADDDSLTRIESEGTRMSRLVDDLLTLARGDRGVQVDRVVVDLDEVYADVLAEARLRWPDRSIEVAAEEGMTVIGDHDQLLRVLRNLVTNAGTYTRAGGPIQIRAELEGLGVRIEVRDGGPGLPPEEAAHVFERFWRADKARNRASGGSGLGMAIVASIVQSHGGSVWFDSAVQTGSTVTLWLPSGLAAAGADDDTGNTP